MMTAQSEIVSGAVVAVAEPVVEATAVVKEFRGGDGSILRVLDEVSLSVMRGEMIAITGASGAGKSTLLHVLGALDVPSSGRVRIGGRDISAMPEDELSDMRNRQVGFVFQFHHLLREFTALENVMMPMRIGGVPEREARDRAEQLLGRVGMGHRQHHTPAALSGGEQQRTAVARALANQPALLLADEPSGNLDLLNAERLHDLFAELASELRVGLVVVTHNQSLAARAGRILTLEGGRLVSARAAVDAGVDAGVHAQADARTDVGDSAAGAKVEEVQ